MGRSIRRWAVAAPLVLWFLWAVGVFGPRDSNGGLRPVPAKSSLPTIRIKVDPEDLERMRRAIVDGDPALGRETGGNKPFVDAIYIDENGASYSSKIGYRGLGQWHHRPEKPSLRVKIRKKSLDGGHRNIELQRPEGALAMRNWLPDRLGRELGLLSAQLEHVRVFINDDYKGVYVRNIRPSSSMLMAAGRIPGALFKGDNWSESLWESSSAWKQRGETADATALFDQFLLSMQQPISTSSITDLESYLDIDAYTRWAALMIIVGGIHTDAFHNHLYHVGPERGKVEVVPWDVFGYGVQATPDLPVEVIRHPLAYSLSHDPRWIHRRNALLHSLLRDRLSPERQIRVMREELARVLPDLQADPYVASLEKLASPISDLDGGYGLVAWSTANLSVKQVELERWIRRRASHVMGHLEDARVATELIDSRPGFTRVVVYGNVAVTVKGNTGANPQILYPGLSKEQRLFEMRPYSPFPVMAFAPSPAPLEYEVEGDPNSLQFANAVTGEPVEPQSVIPETLGKASSIHPRAFDELAEPEGMIVLGPGDVRLSKSLHIGPRQHLLLRAGTRLLMGPDVSIVSRGRVSVEGTATAPVRILPADPGAPWGTFGVVGAASGGSRFSHMHVRGGGPGTDGRVYFKGMFSVYESNGVVIEDCAFGPNARGDDAVSIASSTFIVRDSSWDEALSDALDVDVARGVIERSQFTNSGNDGLDVMGGAVIVRDSQMRGNGDKGISIGEGAALIGERLRIAGNRIGIEVKDDSKVFVSSSRLQRNGTGWHGYRKKKFYRRGGQALLVDSEISLSTRAGVDLGPLSELLLVRTDLAVDGTRERVQTAESVPRQWTDWIALLSERIGEAHGSASDVPDANSSRFSLTTSRDPWALGL